MIGSVLHTASETSQRRSFIRLPQANVNAVNFLATLGLVASYHPIRCPRSVTRHIAGDMVASNQFGSGYSSGGTRVSALSCLQGPVVSAGIIFTVTLFRAPST